MDQTRIDDTREDARRTRMQEIRLSDLWAVLAKRKMTIIALFLLSLLGAALLAYSSPKIYRLEAHMKMYLPKEVTTVKELPTAKDLAAIVGTIDPEKRTIIFSGGAEEITDLHLVEMKGATDKFKIVIEGRNRDMLPEALGHVVTYVEHLNVIRNSQEKITRELDQRIRDLKEAYAKSVSINREIERRLRSSNLSSLGFNPIEVNRQVLDMRNELYRLEQQRLHYRLIQPLDDPFVSKSPVKPNKAMMITVAGLCGLLFGVFLVFFMEYVEGAKSKG
jgi:LPS O-antigen subunit length determinant protein (WzzB/FepE family)